MAKQTSFGVSKAGFDKVEVTWMAPESVDDPRWAEVVTNPAQDINSAAVRNLIISIQSGARSRLAEGAEAVQEFVNSFKTGVRQPGASRRPTLSKEHGKLKFTAEQLAALEASGMDVSALQG